MDDIIEYAATQMADTIREDQKRARFTAALRELATFLDEHPQVPIPYAPTMNMYVSDAKDFAPIARAASWEKGYLDNWFYLRKQFGAEEGIQYEINISRDAICRKVVVGTRIVPAVEAQPEREEDVTEWVCGDVSLLGGKR